MFDLFTRYVVAVALPNQTAVIVINGVLTNWLLKFGFPRRFLTDQGSNFESAIFSNLCLLWHVEKSRTTSYHPESNGPCERVNQTLKKACKS